MAYAQQINQEQEALEQQPELKLSLEARVVLAFKHKTPNRYRLLDKLVRAYIHPDCNVSDKRKYLSEKSKKLLVAILKKILYGETPLLNHKYISKATRCNPNQNANILKELKRILDIKYWDVFTNKNGQNFLRHYTFEINPSIVQELQDAGAWNLEFCPQFFVGSYNNKDISNEIKIRSNRANFSNSDFNSKNTNTELVENSSGVAKGVSLNFSTDTQTLEQAETLPEPQSVETTNPTQPPSTRQREDTPRPSNVVRNGFLGSSKHISEIQPYLTDELCETLRSKSGKLFTNQAIRQITKAIAASKRGQYVEFKHVNGIVSYLTPALANEKRDPNKIGSESYYTLAGMTAEDKLWRQQENYLEGVEQMAMRHVSPENQFKGKLVGTLERSVANSLLLAMQNTSIEGDTLVVSLNKAVELTERQKEVVLAQAQAVFNSGGLENGRVIERVEFVVSPASWQNKGSMTHPQETSQSTGSSPVTSPRLELPKGNWGEVCSAFVAEYGAELYTHWLAGLNVIEEDNTIELRTTSGMVRDRIEQTYLPFFSKVSGEFGINKIELLGQ